MLGLKAAMWDKYDINSYKNIMSRKQQYQSSIFKGCRRQGRNKKNPDRGRKHAISVRFSYSVYVEIRRTPIGDGNLYFPVFLSLKSDVEIRRTPIGDGNQFVSPRVYVFLYLRRNKKNPDRGRKQPSKYYKPSSLSRNKKNPDRGRKLCCIIFHILNVQIRVEIRRTPIGDGNQPKL